ncbi:hypothetical protein ABEB36_007582 [Hypothenemus hampei]|uniref:Uncharacterized protein n=1 Tax=Hypothenemus hampei TaxID=57062 RepID=A0ABD1EUL2_HYPHA
MAFGQMKNFKAEPISSMETNSLLKLNDRELKTVIRESVTKRSPCRPGVVSLSKNSGLKRAVEPPMGSRRVSTVDALSLSCFIETMC